MDELTQPHRAEVAIAIQSLEERPLRRDRVAGDPYRSVWLEPQVDRSPRYQVIGLTPAALDAFHGSIAFFDRSGALVMANRSMSSALAWPPVRVEVGAFKDRLIKNTYSSPTPNGGPATGEFVHRGRLQHLRGAYLSPEHCTPGPSFCVTLREGPRALPTADDLRRRFGLTMQEGRVALCLAEGLSNDEVAEALKVSRHTARHHTEHLFSKMAIASRSEVAWELLRE